MRGTRHDRAIGAAAAAALLFFGLLSVASAEDPVLVPKGIVALSGSHVPDDVLRNDVVVGVSIRFAWKDVEPSEGQYDWTGVEEEMDRVANAGKLVTLRVLSGSAALPPWLLDKVQKVRLIDSNPYHKKTYGQPIDVQVFWDPTLLAAKARLYEEMGSRFARRARLAVVGVAFANSYTDDWYVASDDASRAAWLAAGYTPEKLIAAGERTIDAAMNAFPGKAVTLAGGEVRFDDSPLRVAREVIQYADQRYPGRLIVQDNRLSAVTPPPDQAKGAWKLLLEHRPRVAGQMLWYVAGDSTFRMNRGRPGAEKDILGSALRNGLAYGLEYMEVYLEDLEDAAFTDLFREADRRVGDNWGQREPFTITR